MKPAAKLIAKAIAAASVAACGGGGGGGGGGAPTPPPTSLVTFTQFSAIAPNQTVIMNGTAVTASGNQTSTDISSMDPFQSGAGEVRLTYDGVRALSGISVSTPQSSVTFDRNVAGHSVTCSGATCVVSKPAASGFAIDAFAVGWNYQTFGVWGIDTSPTTYSLGAISVGSPTSGNALPTSGSAQFSGVASGFFFNSAGTPFGTVAGMRADVDFSARNIGFSTSGTSLLPGTGPAQPAANLDLTGTLSYAPGVNSFSGTVTAQDFATSNLSGQASGRFYGPAAEEIGGVYSLSGNGLTRMIGGFGGRRP